MPIHHENLSVIMEIGGMRNIKRDDRWALSAQFVACTTCTIVYLYYCLASCVLFILAPFFFESCIILLS